MQSNKNGLKNIGIGKIVTLNEFSMNYQVKSLGVKIYMYLF